MPFYVALPVQLHRLVVGDGVREIPIESRAEDEVRLVEGLDADGQVRSVRICPEGTRAANYGFDVTPGSRLTGLVTERGICPATEEVLLSLFPGGRAALPDRGSYFLAVSCNTKSGWSFATWISPSASNSILTIAGFSRKLIWSSLPKTVHHQLPSLSLK